VPEQKERELRRRNVLRQALTYFDKAEIKRLKAPPIMSHRNKDLAD